MGGLPERWKRRHKGLKNLMKKQCGHEPPENNRKKATQVHAEPSTSLPAVQDVTRVRAAIIGYSHFRDVPFFQPTLLKSQGLHRGIVMSNASQHLLGMLVNIRKPHVIPVRQHYPRQAVVADREFANALG
ncbi:hypothetical protein E8E15_009191 [Penicillium rubens]|nr:hypothetical protein E8E15_009191 [Penicillium rubens]